jgi:hypothetical protein
MHRHHLLALFAFLLAASAPIDAFAQSRFFTFERNTDRGGLDYNSFESRDAAACSFSCQSENRCKAWTWVRPGVQGPSARCWLKTAVPSAVADRCCISGRRKGGGGIID